MPSSARAYFGWQNNVATATLTASSQAAGLGVGNLQNDQGSAANAWQTVAGVTSATLTIDSGAAGTTWQGFLLARTNLSTAATVRWRVGPREAVVEEVPTLDLNFSSGGFTAPSGWSFTGGNGTYFDSTGTLQMAAANTPRIDYDPVTLACRGLLVEESRTNYVTNPRAEGSTTGVLGAGGAAPTGWSISPTAGLNAQIIGQITTKGLPGLRVRIYGTATGTAATSIEFMAGNGPAGLSSGSQIVKGCWAALSGGSLAGVQTVNLWGQVQDGTGAIVHDNQPAITLTSTLQPFTYVDSCSGGSGSGYKMSSASVILYANQQTAVDVTLDICAAQVEVGGFPTSVILPPSGSPAAMTRTADGATFTATPYMGASALSFCAELHVPSQSNPTARYGGIAGFKSNDSSTIVDFGIDPVSNGVNLHAYAKQANTQYLNDYRYGVATPADYKMALAVQPGDLAVSLLGQAVQPQDKVAPSNPVPSLALGAIGAGIGPGGAFWLQRFRVYNTRLTDNQLGALTSTGSTLVAASATYDSGTISAGIAPGYGQSVVIAPAAAAGQFARLDVADPGNPDGVLNIPLVYAAPAWQLTRNLSYASALGRDDQVNEVVTQGGQEYPQALWQRRRYVIALDGITSAEVWPQVMALDQAARRGGNCLLIPDPDGATVAQETVLGRLKPTADVTYPYKTSSVRSWRAQITERL